MSQDSALKTDINLQPVQAKPFLKWAGGKRSLIPQIAKYLPDAYRCYYEPFVGGGALFFSIAPKWAFLSDVSSELVNTYRIIRDKPAKLIEALKAHHYDKDYYYEVREQDPEQLSAIEQAARMIYLNRTGFNGLYRVNRKGKFNVPFGKYKNPRIVNEANIYACSSALHGITIENFPFQNFPWEMVRKGDFVYFDPPYIPLSRTASFTEYAEGGFTPEDQERLADVYKMLDKRGAKVMLSNSATDVTAKLYSDFKLIECSVPRAINSKGDKRGNIAEYVVVNYL